MQSCLTRFGQTIYAKWTAGILNAQGTAVDTAPIIWVYAPDNLWHIAAALDYTTIDDAQVERSFDLGEQPDGYLVLVYLAMDGETIVTRRSHDTGRTWA